ncbi:serine hydrolase [Nonomuraea sp. NPDC050536]|uniref:serine hydrolase n=1 Tax=Nonomuraea sp. NPDC050536 TaxID=3364366 RepID=UPI0037C9BDFB
MPDFMIQGCEVRLCVLDIDGPGLVEQGADEPVLAASVFKVLVALEAFRLMPGGRERVLVRPGDRTAGPTGFSTFEDEVEVSVRDLVRMMLTVSDNAATDVLIERIGLGGLRDALDRLGMYGTAVPYTLRGMLDSIGAGAGFGDWAGLAAADGVGMEVVWESAAMRTEHGIRTTARDMARLLRMIWRDEAGPAEACARVRALMAQQVTRHRLAMGFGRDARVSAKSGSLFGVVRNEVGVVELPGGRRYAAAVFTSAREPYADENAINSAIGEAAALAVGVI